MPEQKSESKGKRAVVVMEMWRKGSLKARAVFREDNDISMSQEKWHI